MARLALSTVNKALASRGVELVKGKGYFYFEGAAVERCFSTSVMVYRLNQLTLAEWQNAAEKLIAEQRARDA